MNVSAIIVTRGDVHRYRVLASIPEEWEIVIWDNSFGGQIIRYEPGGLDSNGYIARKSEILNLRTAGDLSVYGRYAAIEHAKGELIYVQDDDCVVSDPRALVQTWLDRVKHDRETRIVEPEWIVVCNMPQPFRHDFYSDHCLVGFGSVFHRDAPKRAWWRFRGGLDETEPWVDFNMDWFHRTCDIVFTALTPRVLVDVPYENLPWATDESRMYRQPEHVSERMRMLELVRKVREQWAGDEGVFV